jgi:CRISPR-associated protein Cmr5
MTGHTQEKKTSPQIILQERAMRTREQRMAETAFRRIEMRAREEKSEEYLSFANSFPSLIHSCGLIQAVAFAQAKKKTNLLEDLAEVLSLPVAELTVNARSKPLAVYMLLSREALLAAGWLKRYAQALIKKKDEEAMS